MKFTGTHCLPAIHVIHFFVKIAIFNLLYFLEFEADLYKTSNFCKIQYGETTYGSCFFRYFKTCPRHFEKGLLGKLGWCSRVIRMPASPRHVSQLPSLLARSERFFSGHSNFALLFLISHSSVVVFA